MKPLIVSEFTTNHMGNLNVLLRMVDKAVDAGCDLIKMQKKNVHSFYSEEKLISGYMSPYGKNYEDYRTIFEFEKEDFIRFDNKCKERGVEWFCTVQDIFSLKFILEFDLRLYKISSSNARKTEFLKEVANLVPDDKEIVISMAGTTLEQVETTINLFPNHRLYILHCVAEYPCQLSNLRLGNIKVLKEKFLDDRIKIGYSGHELGFLPSLAAVDLGAEMIERHFCLSRHSFVHHIECSLEPEEFKEMVGIIRTSSDLRKFYEEYLPPISYQSKFGMTDMEQSFLEKQTYGTDYLNGKSKFLQNGLHIETRKNRMEHPRSASRSR